MSSPTLLFGAGGHARVVAELMHHLPQVRLAAVLDDDDARVGAELDSVTIASGHRLTALRAEGIGRAVLGVGAVRGGTAREELAHRLTGAGFELASLVHPRAIVAGGVHIGPGAVVMAGAVVQAGARVEENAIINTRAVVEHDAVVEAHAHVASGAILGGAVQVGRGALVGLGAVVLPGCRVGQGATVGAGAVVIRTVAPGTTVIGVPAAPSSAAGK